MERRSLLLSLGATLLAGCDTSTPATKRASREPVYGHGVVKPGGSDASALASGDAGTKTNDDGGTSNLQVVDVSVDTSAIDGVEGGREIAVPPAQIKTDLRNALLGTLRSANSGGRPVKVNLLIERVYLVSPGQSMMIGGVSTIRGTLWITDAKTGAVVLKQTKVQGTAKGGYVLGGVIGVALTKSPQDDYRATVAGFAADVKKRLLGKQT
ncbi:hypothetical protein [Arenibacterium sp. CAU 1754]